MSKCSISVSRHCGPSHRTRRRKTHLTVTGLFLGTPDYAAPEQIEAGQPVDLRADVYSLGCTAYYLISGKPPFSGSNFVDKLIQQRIGQPARLESRDCPMPAGLEAVLRRRNARQGSGSAFCQLRAKSPPLFQPFCLEQAPVVRRRPLRRSWAIAAAVGVFCLAVLLYLGLFRPGQKQTDLVHQAETVPPVGQGESDTPIPKPPPTSKQGELDTPISKPPPKSKQGELDTPIPKLPPKGKAVAGERSVVLTRSGGKMRSP